MIKCELCDTKFKNNKGLSYHFRIKHGLDLIEYLVTNKIINVPKCKTCQVDIDVITKGSRGRVKILNNPDELKYCSDACMKRDLDYIKIQTANGKKYYKYIKDLPMTDERKAKLKISTTLLWENPDFRNKITKKLKGLKKSETHKKALSESLKKHKRSKAHCDNLSKAITEKYIKGDFPSKIKYNSIKLNKSVALMSSYEFKYSILLDIIKKVKTWKYQPFYLKCHETNKRYIPDFLVTYEDGTKHLVEIDKYKGFKEKYGYWWKLEAAKKWCAENGAEFKYYDITDINEIAESVKSDIYDFVLNIDKTDKNINMLTEILTIVFNSIKLKSINKEYKNNIKIPETNIAKSSEFSNDNTEYMLKFYNNFYDCKWKKARFTPNQAVQYSITLKTIIKNSIKNGVISYNNILSQLNREMYSISLFPDSWAYWIYKKFLKNDCRVLDICGGFGGRLLGFNKCGFDKYEYTYCDANKETCNGTEDLIKDIGLKATVLNQKFEDADIFNSKWDLVFTSIPYYDLEVYNDIDLSKMYRTSEEFTIKFINSIFKLKSKTIVINISEKYEDILLNSLTDTQEYKNTDIFSITLSKHPFQKTPNKEKFFIFNKL